MVQVIANYLLSEKIYESANSEVYRGIRNSDRQPSILKVLKQASKQASKTIPHHKNSLAISKSMKSPAT